MRIKNLITNKAEMLTKDRCNLCGSENIEVVSTLHKKPLQETSYLPDNVSYFRQICHCHDCDVYFNLHSYDLFNIEFYSGNYNNSIETGSLEKRFDRITNLPLENSDNKQRVRRIKQYVDFSFKDDVRILDVGSGTGVFPYEISKYYKKVSAVDLDPSSVGLMKHRIELEHLWQGSISDVPPQEKFHLITLNKILEHVKDPITLIGEAKKETVRQRGHLY